VENGTVRVAMPFLVSRARLNDMGPVGNSLIDAPPEATVKIAAVLLQVTLVARSSWFPRW